ncbi:MAG: cell division protein FtsZ [Oscillospiraceae bacterium]|jgi:cell division protein FtsZ|nr:cell division protein FtsZ [Oscillospiraceae bacterium]
MAFELDNGNESVVSIKVVGIGGGGNNVVNRMMEAGVTSAEMVAVNTDRQALVKTRATHKLQIGEKQTGGKGAGSNPEIGRKSMEESRQDMSKLLTGTDMVFISAGMGGGTGTGAAPIVADIAREQGILTIGIVTKPFHFEGPHRMKQAEAGIEELRSRVDSLIVIPNERLKLVSNEKISFATGFKIADDVLKQSVQSISDLINTTQLINLDFADVSSIMRDAGYAHIGVGRASGKSKAEEASRQAIQSPLLETTINGAKGVIINITGDPDLALDDVELAANMVKSAVHHDANIIFGAAIDESMDDEIRVIVIATGFDEGTGLHEEGGIFSSGSAVGAAPQKQHAQHPQQPEPAAFPAVPPPKEEPPEEDPFESIFRIFNKK